MSHQRPVIQEQLILQSQASRDRQGLPFFEEDSVSWCGAWGRHGRKGAGVFLLKTDDNGITASPRFHQNLRENASLIYEEKWFAHFSAQTNLVCAELSVSFSADNFTRMIGRAGAQRASWHVLVIK
jgi:hypothetical protein